MLTSYQHICRIVNGLLKTALGPPSGSTTTLSPAQDITFRLESVKCLVSIIKSMGTWMDQQMKLDDTNFLKTSENDASPENQLSGKKQLLLTLSSSQMEILSSQMLLHLSNEELTKLNSRFEQYLISS